MGAIDWATLDDREFVAKAEQQIWLSAFASNNPRAPAHKEADAAHDEATRRAKPWLYQRAWNQAYLSAGHQPHERDIEAAKEPSPDLAPPLPAAPSNTTSPESP